MCLKVHSEGLFFGRAGDRFSPNGAVQDGTDEVLALLQSSDSRRPG
jgi:hypothetical protein